MDSLYAYNPKAIIRSQTHGCATGPALDAGNRAQARHDVAFHPIQYLEVHQEAQGLHIWDLGLRASTKSAVRREQFIQDTQNDLHDAVSHFCCILGLLLTR